MFDRFSYKNCPNLATLIWFSTIFDLLKHNNIILTMKMKIFKNFISLMGLTNELYMKLQLLRHLRESRNILISGRQPVLSR